jgi:hypothetical protein
MPGAYLSVLEREKVWIPDKPTGGSPFVNATGLSTQILPTALYDEIGEMPRLMPAGPLRALEVWTDTPRPAEADLKSMFDMPRYRANAIPQALPVPASRERIDMRGQPSGGRIGAGDPLPGSQWPVPPSGVPGHRPRDTCVNRGPAGVS